MAAELKRRDREAAKAEGDETELPFERDEPSEDET